MPVCEVAENVDVISVVLWKMQRRGTAISFRDDPYTLADDFISAENARAMHRNGVIRQMTVVMRHHLMRFITASKKPVAMIVVRRQNI